MLDEILEQARDHLSWIWTVSDNSYSIYNPDAFDKVRALGEPTTYDVLSHFWNEQTGL
jgi:hypothetical protein